MSFEILSTHRFQKELKRLSKKFASLKSDFETLINTLSENPQTGTPLGNNCFKLRLGIRSKGRGKSGGARVITYFYLTNETVYLMTIYDKSEKEDLKPDELKEMIANLGLD